MMNKFVIAVQGPSCSGKSTLIKRILEKGPAFHASPDKLKWGFSDYLERKKHYKGVIGKMIESLILVAINNGQDVIYDLQESIDGKFMREEAEKMGYTYIDVFVEADYEVLLERFRQRIREVKTEGRVIGNMDEKCFREIYEKYMGFKTQNVFVLDSGKISQEEMVKKFYEYVSKI